MNCARYLRSTKYANVRASQDYASMRPTHAMSGYTWSYCSIMFSFRILDECASACFVCLFNKKVSFQELALELNIKLCVICVLIRPLSRWSFLSILLLLFLSLFLLTFFFINVPGNIRRSDFCLYVSMRRTIDDCKIVYFALFNEQSFLHPSPRQYKFFLLDGELQMYVSSIVGIIAC